jgi:diketogulonate reductase-like aldo/keto reductase
MADLISTKFKLTDTVSIPWLSFGLYNIPEGTKLQQAINTAIEAGYRSFDSATLYGNEPGVGKALNESGIPRKEIFITSKVWNSEQGYQETKDAVQRSLDRLKQDYIDLYLLHWPVPGKFTDSWRALEELHAEGILKSIGVSNFTQDNLKALLSVAKIKPALNQVELHPHLAQFELEKYSKAKSIQLSAWSPLKHGKVLGDPTLVSLAKKYGKQPAQIILRWLYQRGIVAAVKAASAGHIIKNIELDDFTLTSEDISAINRLNQDRRIGPDPKTVDYSGDHEFIEIFTGWETTAVA